MHSPAPPVNVRFVSSDGDVIPVECVYIGEVGGEHLWGVVRAASLDVSKEWDIRADEIPASTNIAVAYHVEG